MPFRTVILLVGLLAVTACPFHCISKCGDAWAGRVQAAPAHADDMTETGCVCRGAYFMAPVDLRDLTPGTSALSIDLAARLDPLSTVTPSCENHRRFEPFHGPPFFTGRMLRHQLSSLLI